MKPLERALALALRAVAVQAGDLEAGLRDLLRQALGAVLGAGEDQHGIGIGLLEQLQQQGGFQMLRHRVERVRDRVRRAAEPMAMRLGWCSVWRGQFLDLLREGGREEHGLALGGHVLEDAFHIRQEAHVEHAVGFVQHQDLDRRPAGHGPAR